MNDKIKVFWGTPQNLEEIKQLEDEAEANWDNPEWYFKEQLVAGRIAIASSANRPIGYLVFEIIWGNTPFLSLIRVSPNAQRQGVGQLLVSLFEMKLRELGFTSYVTSTEEINPDTKGFFPKLGVNHIGTLAMKHGAELFYIKNLD